MGLPKLWQAFPVIYEGHDALKGVRFLLYLVRFAPLRHASYVGTTSDESRQVQMNVLLIDDETEICFLLKNMLRREGIACDVAHSMAQGREQLVAGRYEVVFLDIHLPDGLGYQLIPEIRQSQPDTQVIAISAVDNERKNAKDRGADLFIAKPFDKGSILDGLRSLGLAS